MNLTVRAGIPYLANTKIYSQINKPIVSARIFLVILIGFGAGISACSPRTDFDRPVMSVTNPTLIRNSGSYALTRTETIEIVERSEPAMYDQSTTLQPGRLSNFKLTQQETEMRNLGYRLVAPIGRGYRRTAYAGARRYTNREAEGRPLSERSAYYTWLKDGYERTDFSMWTRLIDDVRADEVSALRFTPAAQRVLQVDYDRHQVFLVRGELGAGELPNLTARLAENRRYVQLVLDMLGDRIVAYKYAVDRAQVEVPSDRIYEAQSAIADLSKQIRNLRYILNRDYSGAKFVGVRPEQIDVVPAPIFDYSIYQ